MPTLADLQALRDKAQNQQPDPGITVSGANPNKTPTFADLQALRNKNSNKETTPVTAPTPAKDSSKTEEYTGYILPLKRTAQGETQLAVPGILSDVMKAAKAPGDVYTGKIKPGTPEAYQAAGNVAGLVAGSGFGSKLPSKAPSEFAGAAQRMGMNFSKANMPEDIAKEINRSSSSYFDRLANMIWHREPVTTDISQPGEVASNAIKNFQSRKAEESSLWTAAENSGNAIQKDHSEEINALKELRAKVADRIKSGEDTPDVKKSQALINRALGELGAPVTPEQQIIEKTKDVGGYTKTVTGQRQFPQNAAQTSVKEVEPTTTVGPKSFSETSQSPVHSATEIEDKTKTITQSPYSVTQRIIKGEAPKPPRAGTAGDLVRARRAINEGSYAAADPQVSKDVKNILQGGLSDVAKQDKKFAQTHAQALQKTQKNADIYRDDAKAAKFGFDEETLRDITAKMKNGRDLPTASLEKINNGVDNIKTPEDLLFLKRHLDKPQFSMALRAKAAAILADTGTNIKKVVEQRPMLEQIFKFSGMPPVKIKQSLDDLEVVAKEMERYGIPSSPSVDPGLTRTQQRVKSIVKALTLGLAYSNPKQAMYHMGQAAMPSPNADALSLQALKKAATLPSQSITGPAVGAALGSGIQR